MTDEQLKKALECCNGYDCETCRALKYCDYMHPGALARASLDLITRQKAEIEQWKEEANKYQNLWCIAVDDIEIAKSEAIKAFAERLKSKIWHSPECNYISSITPDYIDNLAKEMSEPSADVEEVRHGKWINDGDCFHCSVCNKTYQLGSLQTIYDVRRCWKYCANCGAKMDKE